MYSLLLKCSADEVDLLSGELWEAGTAGIQEWDRHDGTELIAGFETNEAREFMLTKFAAYNPSWREESTTDWAEESRGAWRAREIGQRLFLAPVWLTDPTPTGRKRLIHNPGLACGTGEHPCTQLALLALENTVTAGARVADIGTGSGILAIGAVLLGADFAVGIDTDEAALRAARENFELNGLHEKLAAGSADCVASNFADIVIANMNATVLLDIFDDLVRITKPEGRLILTGFTDAERGPLTEMFTEAEVTALDEWRCLRALTPSEAYPPRSTTPRASRAADSQTAWVSKAKAPPQ